MEAHITKILIFTFGTLGDVQPYVALGLALKARRYDVTICTGQGFEDFIETHGLRSRSASINYRELVQLQEVRERIHQGRRRFRASKPTQSLKRMQLFVQQLPNEMLGVAREIKPDLIISNATGYLAHNIGRWMGIPSIPSMLQPMFAETRAFPPAVLPALTFGKWGNLLAHRLINRTTRKAASEWAKGAFGSECPKVGSYIEGYHPRGSQVPHLHGYSRHIIPKPSDWGADEHITGYWMLEQPRNWTPQEDLRTFLEGGQPPVYVGFGSMPSMDARKLTEVVVRALANVGRRGVLATGWGALEAGLHGPHVFHLNHAPHDWLFPRCAAVVHHGGAGTTHEGLRWGRATVICPAGGNDQVFWGKRVAALGAGPKPLALRSVTADKLAKAISFALDPAVLSRAQVLGEAIRNENGAAAAADLIHQVMSAEPELKRLSSG